MSNDFEPWETDYYRKRRKLKKELDLYPLLLETFILPVIGRLTNIKIWQEYQRMLDLENRSLEELKRNQFASLKEIVGHAYQTVPFYRETFDRIGLKPEDIRTDEDFNHVPPTTKEDIMSHFPERITAHGSDRTQWKYVASSGTTRQIIGIHDFRKANLNWAAGLRAHKLAGNHTIGKKWMEIPPHMCTNICGIDDTGKSGKIIFKIYGSLNPEERLSVITFNVKGMGCHAVAKVLNLRENIMIRSGFHCAQPLHDKLGIGPSARVSFYIYNTKEEVEILVGLLGKLAQFI